MEFFDIFLVEAILNGILLGGLLALLSLGLNLIFGVIDVVWISYAELMMIGMYSIYWTHSMLGWPLYLAFPFGIAGVALVHHSTRSCRRTHQSVASNGWRFVFFTSRRNSHFWCRLQKYWRAHA
jgi:branched-subunit amino acid ABC-type transport system permease component